MSDLWHEASADHDLEAREASLDRADAEMLPVYAFLFQSRSARELEHRLAFAAERIERVAAACGLPAEELEETARRRYALLKEALPEGVDPVAPVLQAGQSFGSGPAEGYEHDEGPDYSHGYAEIPQGAPGGPAPQVVTPQAPEIPAPEMGATAGLCRCGSRLTKKSGRCKSCKDKPGACLCMRATADVTSGSPPSGAPMSAGLPAGVGGATSTPDGMKPGGLQSGTQATSAGTGLQGGTGTAGYDTTPDQAVTAARKDPVRRQVEAVAATVQASNPYLAPSECRRVARRVVGSYLRQADMASSVISDEPWAPSAGTNASPGDSGGDGGHGMGLGEYGLGKALINKIPGAGGGAAAGAGMLGEAAELAVL
jgi:hypothetical protein